MREMIEDESSPRASRNRILPRERSDSQSQACACYVAIPEPMWRRGLADKLLSCADFRISRFEFRCDGIPTRSESCAKTLPTKLIISTRSTKVEMARPEVCLNLSLSSHIPFSSLPGHQIQTGLARLENLERGPRGQAH
jgi:hypothetical protein